MPSERIQRRIDSLLDEADAAVSASDWVSVAAKARAALAIDGGNEDALSFLKMAEANGVSAPTTASRLPPPTGPTAFSRPLPASFASGRYTVHGLLGEGGSKKVYLAHDTRLERDVALAVVEGLDPAALERVRREARAVARLGDHPNIVAVYDTAEDHEQLVTVYQYMPGGSLANLVARGPVPLERIVTLGAQVCDALALAHGRGVIHRDVKPANVLLSERGDAKLGDFGLAAALDRTRLTEQGTFLGTAAYMAPEQAMGQPADARSDLYSLGCVLYELITGRPPFVGDDTVAVVTQHLNTAPVAPSWHRVDVPPGLEALVLRLLEKDPGKRPQSATEAAQALRDIQLAAVAPASQSSVLAPQSSDPLYRTVFVGREQELRQLQNAFDTALSGNGGLVMVVGEPGIGKTALTGQLATYVAMRSGRALHGNCYEEGSLALPYLPFVEAMRSYVLDRDAEALRSEMGSGAPYVAKIISEVREKVGTELPPGGDPEDERWRLLSGVTTFLKNAAGVQPLMLLLEDLHWSDRGTLDLLNHLGRNLEGARLLVVGTYRDVEVDRSHPLSAALADLRRSTNFSRVTLRGLGVDDVAKMLSAIAGREVPRQVADQVHGQTEGNPLFVQEMARWLVEEGHFRGKPGDSMLGVEIPEGLRDVIGRRLSRLSPETNRLLAIAAVIGRDFDLATVRAIAGVDEETLLTDLEEGVRVGVLEERSQVGGVHYRFAHAFFRQALYEELGAARRLRLHQQTGRTLEQRYGQRASEHATELAEHFSHSTDAEDLAKAVQYGELAAQRAVAAYAYGEAVLLLERAMDVQEVFDPGDRARRLGLLVALGNALQPVGDNHRVLEEIAPSAWSVAESLADADGLRSVARLAWESLGRIWGPAAFRRAGGQLWLDRLARHAGESTVDALRVEVTRNTLMTAGEGLERTSWTRGMEAYQQARRLDDQEALFGAATLGLLQRLPPPDLLPEMAYVLQEMHREPREGVPSRLLAAFLANSFSKFLMFGDRPAAERCKMEHLALAERVKDELISAAAQVDNLVCALLDGELWRLLAEYDSLIGSPVTRNDATFIAVRAEVLLGRQEEAVEKVRRLEEDAWFDQPTNHIRVLHLALTGAGGEARALLTQQGTAERVGEEAGLGVLSLLEAAVVLRESHVVRRVCALIEGAADLSFVAPALPLPGRVLGQAHALLGESVEARRFFERGLRAAEKIRFRPEVALTRFGLAELLLHDPDERKEALEHLEFAIAEFQAMNMAPSLQEAMRLRLSLQGLGGSDPSSSIVAVTDAVQADHPDLSVDAAADGTVTLMFTDIENSTALTEQLGDAKWVELLREHNAVVEREVKARGGRVVKNRGDGFMLAFADHGCALDCALALQRAFQGNEVVRVRIGLHVGNPVREGEDFFGTDVNLAARVADRALGGQVLVSSLLRELVAPSGEFSFDEGCEVELKGLAGTHRVFAVVGA